MTTGKKTTTLPLDAAGFNFELDLDLMPARRLSPSRPALEVNTTNWKPGAVQTLMETARENGLKPKVDKQRFGSETEPESDMLTIKKAGPGEVHKVMERLEELQPNYWRRG